MTQGTHTILRGVKITGLFTAALVFTSVVSVISPRPAHAEGFLSQTVKCLVQTVFLTSCRETPITPAPQTPAPTTPPAPAESSVPPQDDTTPASGSVSHAQPLYTPIAPLPEERLTLPELPSPDTSLTRNYASSAGYVAAVSFYSKYGSNSSVSRGEPALLEPSQEGWQIAGVAWYWWLAFLGIVSGVYGYIRARRSHREMLLPNS